uniref:Uncharacterized protein n=1 Tax=Arundo donax TaxID=35708 RepID=A0A0A8ZAC7_ARUDO
MAETSEKTTSKCLYTAGALLLSPDLIWLGFGRRLVPV